MQPLRRTQYRGFNSSAPKGETRSLSEKRFFSPPAAVLNHSVLSPERFSGHAAFHLRYPVDRDSPEPHPPIVLSAWRTPESFTPSADFRRFPIGFHCRYSVIAIVASYHTFPRLSTALFRSYSCVFRLIPGKSPIFPAAADAFCDFSTIFHARTNVFLYSFAGSTVSPAALFRCGRPDQKTFAPCRLFFSAHADFYAIMQERSHKGAASWNTEWNTIPWAR